MNPQQNKHFLFRVKKQNCFLKQSDALEGGCSDRSLEEIWPWIQIIQVHSGRWWCFTELCCFLVFFFLGSPRNLLTQHSENLFIRSSDFCKQNKIDLVLKERFPTEEQLSERWVRWEAVCYVPQTSGAALGGASVAWIWRRRRRNFGLMWTSYFFLINSR